MRIGWTWSAAGRCVAPRASATQMTHPSCNVDNWHRMPSASRCWAISRSMGTITVRGLPGDGAAYHVRSQLVERGYATRLGRSPAGDLVVTVTTEHYLRAEVEGSSGSEAAASRPRSRRTRLPAPSVRPSRPTRSRSHRSCSVPQSFAAGSRARSAATASQASSRTSAPSPSLQRG